MKKIAVIGGGITGVTTSYALAKRGFDVTLFEKHRYPAMETSFANGGQLSASNAEVWNSLSTIFKGLKWMMKSDAPLLLNPKPSWHKYSWLAQFVAAIPQYKSNTIETTRLAIEARDFLFQWAEQEGIDFNLKKEGILHIYRDKAGYKHAEKVTKLLAQGGLDRRAVTPEEMRSIEPTLAGNYYGGFFTESDSTGDIHRFTVGLADALSNYNCTIRCNTEITDVSSNGQQATLSFKTDGQEDTQTFDSVVVCSGVGSRAIAKKLGDNVNIYPVKGYSITVNLNDELSQQSAPNVSLLDDETKLVTSRLGVDRFRVAGTAEYNGVNKDIRADRIEPLIRWVEECFPNVNTRQVVPWCGLRPMMPNMMPKYGGGALPNVFYNTGHGHLGWTLSAATADSVAEMVAQKYA